MTDMAWKALVSPYFVVAYSALIIILFGGGLAWLWDRRSRIIGWIDCGKSALQKGFVPEEGEGADEGARRKGHFASDFSRIDRELEANPVLSAAWEEYRGALLPPAGPGQGGELAGTGAERAPWPDPGHWCGSCSAEACFGEDSPVAAGYSARFLSWFPNILTGIGILGTFLGLAAGIHLAEIDKLAGAALSEDAGFASSLEPLLRGAGLAFMTSVWGLGLSICFSLAEKALYRKMSLSLSGFCRLLNLSVARLTPEAVAKRHLDLFAEGKAAAEKAERARSEERGVFEGGVREFLAGFWEGLREELSLQVTARIREELEGIAGILRDMHENRSAAIAQAVKAMSESFLAALAGAVSAASEELGDRFRSVGDQFARLTESLREAGQALDVQREAAARAAASLREAAEALTSAALDARTAAAGAGEAAAGMGEAAEKARQGQAEAATELGDRLDALFAGLSERAGAAAKGLSDAVGAGIDGFSHDLKKAAEAHFDDQEKLFQEAETRLEAAAGAVARAVTGLPQAWDTAAKAADAVLSALKDGIEAALASEAGSLHSRMDLLFAKAGERAAAISATLAGAVGGIPGEWARLEGILGMSLSGLAARLEATAKGAADEQKRLLEDLSEKIGRSEEQIAISLASVPGAQQAAYGRILSQLEAYNEKFTGILDAAAGGSEGMLAGLRESMGSLHAQIAETYGRITKTLGESA
ncbi:MAG: hypothetical protein LBW85_07315, partial [Deltaproteobacteria bacterium]|nr:hypothetical protein [Deltaproteobacteria bacterium]